MLNRRALLAMPVLAGVFAGAIPPAWALPRRTLTFPRDAGAHPDTATEWWYLTGYANVTGVQAALGFQVTFFRSRVDTTQAMQSRLAARQLLFAHAAVTDVRGKKLWHDQRIARWSGEPAGRNPADTASASLQDTSVVLRDWSLRRTGADLQALIPATDFSMDLTFKATQPVLLQGVEGLSRKGPEDKQVSYYYSMPQLQVSGSIAIQGERKALESGSVAWLDHEWSQEVLHPQAVGWDWIGINLFDGSALTAFQLRDKEGRALWDGGSFRSGGAGGSGTRYVFSRGEVLFRPQRTWRSAMSKASYPVEWIVRTPADFYTIRAMVDNQELDSRQSTGSIYWEGLCEAWDSKQQLVGRGYLEMTGYAAALKI
ncbi:MAG: carotenoid 1,2-hydratase [Burkholderiales bacterium]|nr:carotenoid 1,2-hydratase [Burkholderiales bacterium]